MSTRGSFRVRWMIFGILILQLGWVLAVPPFRGIDEWDHAFRASAVAHGQWVAEPGPATRGTGAIVSAGTDIVRAARDECERLSYTGSAECVGTTHGDLTDVASGAGRYYPLFYVLVGYPSLPFEGFTALYVMRLVSLLMCLAMIGAAVGVLRRWAGPVQLMVMTVGLTPMVLYSTSVVAPNGLEIASGLALWAALGGLANSPHGESQRVVVALATLSASTLVTLRSLGPLWALLVLATAMVAWPKLWFSIRRLVSRWGGRLAMGLVLAAALSNVGWVLAQRSLVLGTSGADPTMNISERLTETTLQIPVWILQLMGAFPYRDQPAHILVYCCFTLLIGVALAVAVRRADFFARLAMLIGMVLALLIPYAITFATVREFGPAWQGRYVLPYLIGLPVLAGGVWATRVKRVDWRVMAPGVVLTILGQVAGPVQVVVRELRWSPSAGTGQWPLAPQPAVLGAIMAMGAIFMVMPIALAASRQER